MKKIVLILLGIISIANVLTAQTNFKPFVNQISDYIDSDTTLKVWKTDHAGSEPNSEASNVIIVAYNYEGQCVRMENLMLNKEIEISIKYYFFNGLPIKIIIQESNIKNENSSNETLVYRKKMYVSNWKKEDFTIEEQGKSEYSSDYIFGLFDYKAYMMKFYMDPEK